jgi:hypothetical protein
MRPVAFCALLLQSHLVQGSMPLSVVMYVIQLVHGTDRSLPVSVRLPMPKGMAYKE